VTGSLGASNGLSVTHVLRPRAPSLCIFDHKYVAGKSGVVKTSGNPISPAPFWFNFFALKLHAATRRLGNIGIGHAAIDSGVGYTYLSPQTGREFSAATGLTYINPSTQYQNGMD
jgi:hypothetical protein